MSQKLFFIITICESLSCIRKLFNPINPEKGYIIYLDGGEKMGKKLWIKLPLLLFVLVVALAACGTATAKVNPNAQLPDVFVVESGNTFTGSTAIQDSIDSSNTIDENHVYIQPKTYSEQIVVSKSLRIRGMGANPEDTTIEFNTDGNVVTIPEGVTVTMENLAITNTGTGRAILNNGALNLINCVITDNYVESTVESTVEMVALSSGAEYTVTTDSEIVTLDLTEDSDPLTIENPSTIFIEATTTPSSEPTTTETTESMSSVETDLPLTTMAYGMLMVVGGVVFPRKNKLKE